MQDVYFSLHTVKIQWPIYYIYSSKPVILMGGITLFFIFYCSTPNPALVFFVII